jgi:hypothetical protein
MVASGSREQHAGGVTQREQPRAPCASGGAVHLLLCRLALSPEPATFAKHLLVIRNLLMRGLLLAGVTVLTASAAAHAETKEARVILPDTITGDWCWVESGNENNRNQQIFVRSTPEDCHVADGLISIDQDGIQGEGGCAFEKVEQIAANAYLIYIHCDDDAEGPATYKIIDGKLVITNLSEG